MTRYRPREGATQQGEGFGSRYRPREGATQQGEGFGCKGLKNHSFLRDRNNDRNNQEGADSG